jgi:23S rRNA (uracil1939-C5)-methyltransferase
MSATEEIELEIGRLGSRGDGVGEDAGRLIYVPFTTVGDRVRVRLGQKRGDGLSARLLDIVRPGPDRVSPPCRHFTDCGGCALQHLSAPAEQAWKRQLAVDALNRRGLGDIDVEETINIPPGARRRTTFSVVRAGGRLLLGYLGRASHQVVPIDSCTVLEPVLEGLIKPLAVLAAGLEIPKKGLNISLTATASGVDVVIGGQNELDLALRERLTEFAEAQDLARLSWGVKYPELVLTRRTPAVKFGGVAVEPAPGGFLQAGAVAEQVLSDHVLDHLSDAKRTIDLFSGIGTFALALAAGGASVAAYDGDDAAIEALTAAVHRSAGRINIGATVRDLERRPLELHELKGIEALVLDPPRAGAKAQCETLATSEIRKIAYVSCNPGTFSRDARKLVDGGYRLVKVSPINQFPWSSHIELIGRFERL